MGGGAAHTCLLQVMEQEEQTDGAGKRSWMQDQDLIIPGCREDGSGVGGGRRDKMDKRGQQQRRHHPGCFQEGQEEQGGRRGQQQRRHHPCLDVSSAVF